MKSNRRTGAWIFGLALLTVVGPGCSNQDPGQPSIGSISADEKKGATVNPKKGALLGKPGAAKK